MHCWLWVAALTLKAFGYNHRKSLGQAIQPSKSSNLGIQHSQTSAASNRSDEAPPANIVPFPQSILAAAATVAAQGGKFWLQCSKIMYAHVCINSKSTSSYNYAWISNRYSGQQNPNGFQETSHMCVCKGLGSELAHKDHCTNCPLCSPKEGRVVTSFDKWNLST